MHGADNAHERHLAFRNIDGLRHHLITAGRVVCGDFEPALDGFEHRRQRFGPLQIANSDDRTQRRFRRRFQLRELTPRNRCQPARGFLRVVPRGFEIVSGQVRVSRSLLHRARALGRGRERRLQWRQLGADADQGILHAHQHAAGFDGRPRHARDDDAGAVHQDLTHR